MAHSTPSCFADTLFSQIRSKYHGLKINKSWIKELLKNGRMTPEQIYKKWLITDICSTGADELPLDIMDRNKTELVDVIPLQVQSALNVGASFYSQLKKLSGKEVNEPATQNTQYNAEPSSSRMLFFNLTDGSNTINGMEYRPCSPQLSVNILPGTKLLVWNITSRLGILLLQPGNFRVLGGCVEWLRAANTQERLLKAALVEDEEDDEMLEEEENSAANPATANRTTNPTTANRTTNPATANRTANSTTANNTANNTARGNQTDRNVRSNQAENGMTGRAQSSPRNQPNLNNVQNTQPNRSANMNHVIPSSSNSASIRGKKGDERNSNQSTITQYCQSANKRSPYEPACQPNKQTKSEAPPPIKAEDPGFCDLLDDITAEFFEHIEEPKQSVSPLAVTVRTLQPNMTFPLQLPGTISTLCSKLTPKPEWTIQCKLSDLSGDGEFRLAELLLAKMIGFTSTEFKQLQPVSKTNQTIKDYLRKGLEACQSDLRFLTGVFTVQPNTSDDKLCPFEVIGIEFEKLDGVKEKEMKDFVMTKCGAT